MNLPMEEDAMAHVGRGIERRLEEGGVRRAQDHEHLVASPIGAVPKHSVDGQKDFRPIHHLSHPKRRARDQSVNDGIDSASVSFQFYQMDGMLREIGAATRRDPKNRERRALWKVDLKDAYRHVVIEHTDARLLGFFWPGLGFLYETQLSFGGRSAPFIFNLVAEGFEWILRSFGVECHHYLDDSFGWLDSSKNLPGVVRFIEEVARALGLSTAVHKTVFGPEIEVLGITVNCDKGTAYISEEKLKRIRAQIDEMGESTTLAQVQSLAGSLVFVTRVCMVGKAFLRRLFDQVRICEASPFGRQRLTRAAHRELKWWKETITELRPMRYLADDPSFMPQFLVWSDASGTLGIGGHLDNNEDEFSERVPRKHRDKTILFKEALAVLRCTELWADRMHRHQVVFNVDNQALVSALNKGSCAHRPTQALIRKVYTLAAWNSFSFRAVWLSSEDNARADRLSRFKSYQPLDAHDDNSPDANFDPDIDGDDNLDECDHDISEQHMDDNLAAHWFNQFA
jgi:hypothetical protein